MMDYAVVLYFDGETENKIQTIINVIAEHGVNRYMVETKIPPHITIGAFEFDTDVDTLIHTMNNCIDRFSSGEVFWASIGVFNPYVLYLAPVLNKYLLQACEKINEELGTIARVGDCGHYLPYQWVPHTALATKLKDQELKTAFEVVHNLFKPFGGTVNRIVLAQCNPYKEIKIWHLC